MAISPKKVLFWFGIFTILLGLIFTAVGGGLSYSAYSFSRTSVATSGVVTDVEVKLSSNSTGSGSWISYTYRPTVSFYDQSGAPQSAQTYLSSSGYNYPVGTKLKILYTPEDPSHLRLDNWFALWGFGLISLGLGLLFFFGGIGFMVASKKAKNQPDAPGAPRKTAHFSYSSAEDSEQTTPTIRRK